MICRPCKTGVHLGNMEGYITRMGDSQSRPPAVLEICKGDTWCDCQHRVEERWPARPTTAG